MDNSKKTALSRRKFTQLIGVSTAGLVFNPAFLVKNASASEYGKTLVATATVSSYNEALLKEAVSKAIENLGGLGDIIKPGDSVGIKINLTGGQAQAAKYQLTTGKPVGETYWTNPVLLKVVGQAVKDAGAGKLYILEALNDWESINNFGYKEVIAELGATFIDLNGKAPYTDYIEKSVGDQYLIYPKLTLNGIFNELNCLISMPKAKQHATAGVTHGMKNLIGILPIPSGVYNQGAAHRAGIHQLRLHDGVPNNNLCRVILDLNRANPVRLVVNDAVKTVLGSEGPWTGDVLTLATFNKIIIGKDPVAVDAVSTSIIGFNPMAADLKSPFPKCINYLKLASEKGLGEYDLANIEIIDSVITGIGDEIPALVQLDQNFPNPFKTSTTIRYVLPDNSDVQLNVYTISGHQVAELVNQKMNAGTHEVIWNAGDSPNGIYFISLKTKFGFTTKKMTLSK
jgi:uncharacterized protein (DUF362 family)